MSRRLTSRDEILNGSYALAQKYGLASISIRGVAEKCGVSTGTIYNYFPSRDELAAATAAKFFSEAFYEGFCHPEPGESYLGYCERLFAALDEKLSRTGSDWLTQLHALEPGAREAGRQRMNDLLSHIVKGLESVLSNDPNVKQEVLMGALDAHSVCRFTLNGMFDTLRRGEHDCRTMLAFIERTLY